MTLGIALVLGVLQGLTEFFPVSSSGHLALFGHWLGLQEPDLVFDILVHIATLAAIIFYFRKDIAALFGNLLGKPSREVPPRTWTYLIIATLPAAIVGIFFGDYVETAHGHPKLVGGLLLFNGLWLLGASRKKDGNRQLKDLTWQTVLIIGIAQVFAILPGISRSGMTIVAGMLLGMQRRDAGRWAFLMALPAIGGAGILGLIKLLKNLDAMSGNLWGAYAVGFFAALISGFAALAFLMKLLEGPRFFHFSYYCLALGALALII